MKILNSTKEIFLQKMRADYENGLIKNPAFMPYFEWKFYHAPLSIFTRKILHKISKAITLEIKKLDEKYPRAFEGLIQKETIQNPWNPYMGFKEDRYLYSYLMAIDNLAKSLIYNKKKKKPRHFETYLVLA